MVSLNVLSRWAQLVSVFRACLHGVGEPGLVGLVSFVFTLWGTQKKKKPAPLDRGPPLHVNRVLISDSDLQIQISKNVLHLTLKLHQLWRIAL